jgi:hypothetical protein
MDFPIIIVNKGSLTWLLDPPPPHLAVPLVLSLHMLSSGANCVVLLTTIQPKIWYRESILTVRCRQVVNSSSAAFISFFRRVCKRCSFLLRIQRVVRGFRKLQQHSFVSIKDQRKSVWGKRVKRIDHVEILSLKSEARFIGREQLYK